MQTITPTRKPISDESLFPESGLLPLALDANESPVFWLLGSEDPPFVLPCKVARIWPSNAF